MEEYDGQMPCLVDNGEAYTESDEVVAYIEYFYPEPTLSLKDDPDKMDKVCVCVCVSFVDFVGFALDSFCLLSFALFF